LETFRAAHGAILKGLFMHPLASVDAPAAVASEDQVAERPRQTALEPPTFAEPPRPGEGDADLLRLMRAL
jgi:hypothetical protein